MQDRRLYHQGFVPIIDEEDEQIIWHRPVCHPGTNDIAFILDVVSEPVWYDNQCVPHVETRYFCDVTLDKDGHSMHLSFDHTWSFEDIEVHVFALLTLRTEDILKKAKTGTKVCGGACYE